MKSIIKLFSMSLLMLPFMAFGQTANENEIFIDQTGDTLTLSIDQIGYGNKVCGDLTSGVCSSDWSITGNSLTIDINQNGNLNSIIGPIVLDSSTLDMTFTGDSNVWDWNIGYIGSADSSDMLVNITGDSNTMDLDWGYAASAERLDMDLTIVGDTNTFDVDLESDDITWNFDITGSGNSFATSIKDGAYHSTTFELTGDDATVAINQWSGSCPTGINSCYSVLNATFNGDDATITINQKDTSD